MPASLITQTPWTGSRITTDAMATLLADLSGMAAPDLPEQMPLAALPSQAELPAHAPALLALTGYPGSGKDVLADYLQTAYRGVERLAFSDVIIVEANEVLSGIEPLAHHHIHTGNKSWPAYRTLLQTLGKIRREEREEHWVDRLRVLTTELMQRPGVRTTIMTGARVESDLVLVRELGGKVGRVYRPHDPKPVSDNPIEHQLDHLERQWYDFCFDNDREGDFAHYLRQIEDQFGYGTSFMAYAASLLSPGLAWGGEARVRAAVANVR